MNKILILEGADGVGKTTAATAFAKHSGRRLIHYGPPAATSWEEEYLLPLAGLISQGEDELVMDRSVYGEPVWSDVLNRASLFTPWSFISACNTFAALGAKVLVIDRDPEAITAELIGRSETDQHIAQALAARKKYLELADYLLGRTPVRVISSDLLHADVEAGRFDWGQW